MWLMRFRADHGRRGMAGHRVRDEGPHSGRFEICRRGEDAVGGTSSLLPINRSRTIARGHSRRYGQYDDRRRACPETAPPGCGARVRRDAAGRVAGSGQTTPSGAAPRASVTPPVANPDLIKPIVVTGPSAAPDIRIRRVNVNAQPGRTQPGTPSPPLPEPPRDGTIPRVIPLDPVPARAGLPVEPPRPRVIQIPRDASGLVPERPTAIRPRRSDQQIASDVNNLIETINESRGRDQSGRE